MVDDVHNGYTVRTFVAAGPVRRAKLDRHTYAGIFLSYHGLT
jgi:hypothetical protein